MTAPTKRKILGAVVAIVALLVFMIEGLPSLLDRWLNTTAPHPTYEIDADTAALHDSLFVADLHADSLLWNRNILRQSSRGHVDIPRLQRGNVGLQVFTAVTKVPRGQNYDSNSADSDIVTLLATVQLWPSPTWSSLFERAAYQAQKLAEFSNASDGELRFVKTRDDLARVVASRLAGENTVGGIFGIEGAHPLEGDVANLDRLFAMGLRVIGLTHFFDNEIGGSLHGESGDGLSPFGRQVVERAAELEMIIDVAHASPQMVRDVLALSKRPVILSHGGIKKACSTARNLDDLLMAELAEHGGILGMGFWAGAVCNDSPEGIALAMRTAVDLMGIDHVGLGSDYDGTVEVTMDSNELAALTAALRELGFSDAEIGKLMGGNIRDFFLRYLPIGE